MTKRDDVTIVRGELPRPSSLPPPAALTGMARYEDRESLGEGGMGEVRLCRDRGIGREVAMKAVRPAFAKDPEIHARFVREARVQAQLEHPAIVPVYDVGYDDEGRAYFTMKRVRGVTLAEILERLRRGDDAAAARDYGRHKLLAAFVQVCRAIDYAHERGVLHRDVKPANVMLGPYGEVYVLDWGVAHVSVGDDADAPEHDGEVMGTPAYMAPEQVRGEELDARTDVYGLGAVLFEILTLEALHGEGSTQDRLKRAARGAEARPSIRAPGKDVPPELEAACVHACALDRGARFASAGELADAVEAYLSGDRDVELRRELAALHYDRARDAASRATVPGAALDDRRAALAEAGRAVALAPDDDRPRALLVELLTTPPAEAPPEVLETVTREYRDSHVRMLPRVAFTFVVLWPFILPAILILGIRSMTLVLFAASFWWVAAAMAWGIHRFGRSRGVTQKIFAVITASGVAAVSVFFGPLVIVPSIAAAIGITAVLQLEPENRRFTTVTYALAVLVPALLVIFRVHPVAHETVEGGGLTIFPGAIELTRNAAIAYATAIHMAVLVLGCAYASKYRAAMASLSLTNHLQRWQLQQLVPRAAGQTAVPRPDT